MLWKGQFLRITLSRGNSKGKVDMLHWNMFPPMMSFVTLHLRILYCTYAYAKCNTKCTCLNSFLNEAKKISWERSVRHILGVGCFKGGVMTNLTFQSWVNAWNISSTDHPLDY